MAKNEVLPYERIAPSAAYASVDAYVEQIKSLDNNAAALAKSTEDDAELLQDETTHWQGILAQDMQTMHNDARSDAEGGNGDARGKVGVDTNQFNQDQLLSNQATAPFQTLTQKGQTNFQHATDTETNTYQMSINSFLQTLSAANQAIAAV